MNLPPEIITYILGYLDLKNLLKCRLVSKYFKLLISKMSVSSLAICHEQSGRTIGNYFHSEKSIMSGYFLSRLSLRMFENAFFMELLLNVKRMYVDCSVVRLACLDEECFLNQMQQVKQLQINSLNQCMDVGRFDLKLENVQILSISSINLYKLKLDCPKLRAFSTADPLAKYEFAYPETIQNLDIFKFDRCIRELKNLESICIGLGNTVDDTSVFELFSNLKELKFKRRMKEEILLKLVSKKRCWKASPELYYLGEKMSKVSF